MTKFEIGGHQSKEFIQSHNIIIDIDIDIDVDVDMKAIVKFYLIVLIVYVIG